MEKNPYGLLVPDVSECEKANMTLARKSANNSAAIHQIGIAPQVFALLTFVFKFALFSFIQQNDK